MVIQRWQTLLLLVAVILMAVLNFLPFAHEAEAGMASLTFAKDAPILLVIDVLVCVLLVLGIFMFKNLKLQMRVTILSIVLMCVLAVTGIVVVYRHSPEAHFEWVGAVLLLVCSVVLALGAHRCMLRDYRLLRSADRLR